MPRPIDPTKPLHHQASRLRITGPMSAFDFLGGIIGLIEADDAALDMSQWGYKDACGTHACVSGWANVMLTGQVYKGLTGVNMARWITGRFDGESYTAEGKRTIDAELYDLFIDRELTNMPMGPALSAEVIKRLRAFMAKHESVLRARMLAPMGPVTLTRTFWKELRAAEQREWEKRART